MGHAPGSGGAPASGHAPAAGHAPEAGHAPGAASTSEAGRAPGASHASGPAQAGQAPRQEARTAPSRPVADDGWGAPVETASAAPAPSAAGGIDVNVVRQRWPQILEAVQRRSRVAWMTIMEGVAPASVEGNLLTIAFENDGKRKNFTMGRREGVLAEVLREQLGVDWRIDAVLGGSLPAAARPAAPPAPPTWEQPRQSPQRPAPAAAPPAASAPPARQAPAAPSAPQAPPVPQPSEPLPPPPEAPMDEEDADVEGGGPPANGAVSGLALLQRELGARVIREIDHP